MWVAVAAAVVAVGYGAYQKSAGNTARKKAQSALDAQGQLAYERGAMSDQETTQYQGSFDLGKTIEQINKYNMGLAEAPDGYQNPAQQYVNQTGELGANLYNTALADVKDPYATYESQFQPQLKAAEDFVNASMQKRGLLSSGLNIENMGRAGVDLALGEAQQRMQYRADALARGAGMADVLQNTQANNLANLSNLYNQQQGYGITAAGRQAGQAISVLPTVTAAPQAQLGYGYGQLAAGNKSIGQGVSILGSAIGGGSLGSSLFGGAKG